MVKLLDFQAKDTIAEESKATTRIVDFSFEISSVIESFNNSDMDRSDSGTLVRKMSDENLKNAEKHTVLGFTTPLTFCWFFSVAGTEYCHTYFWIAKDLAWMQGWRKCSLFFGLSALIWSLTILYHGIRTGNLHEIWNFVALFLWLFANFWWMTGEVHDYEYVDAAPISEHYAYSSTVLLSCATIWLIFFYAFILPCNLIPVTKASLAEYDDGQMQPRLPIFKNFRQYENLHMLIWIGKDLAWITLNITMWFICFVPTILIAADFVYLSVTSIGEDSTVRTVHFGVVLIWVIGNSVWALGDLFVDDYDDPMMMWDRLGLQYIALLNLSADSLMTARWYSSWILFADLIPIIILYTVWIALTSSGRLSSSNSSPTASGRDGRRSRLSSPAEALADEDNIGLELTKSSGSANATALANFRMSLLAMLDRFSPRPSTRSGLGSLQREDSADEFDRLITSKS